MNCSIHIHQRYPDLAQPDTARYLNSQKLAVEAVVSQSSVVKFAQKLGFKGFPTLKLAISEALASNPNPHSIPVHNQIRVAARRAGR